MHGDVMLRVRGVVPVREVFEGHVLLEDRSGPAPRRQFALITCERVAWMCRPVRKRHMFIADEKCLTGAVAGRPRREVHDLDAVALRRSERTAIGVRHGVAARFGMAWQVEQGVEATADTTTPLEHQYFEAVLFEGQRGLEARKPGTDDDHIGLAVAGGVHVRRQAREGGGGG